MRVTRRVRIEAPVERVFAMLEDPERTKRWMRGLVEARYASRPVRVGTRFTQRITQGKRVAEYTGEVTAYEPPTRFAVRIGNERFAFDVDYRLHDEGGATLLDYEARSQAAGGAGRLADAVFGWLTRGIAKKQLRRLKQVAEAGG